MEPQEWMEIFARFTPEQQNDLVLVLKNGGEINVDLIVRYEMAYMVVRGRVAGTDNEGRMFFVPYEQLTCMLIDKVTKVTEVQILYGEKPTFTERDLAAESAEEEAEKLAAAEQLAAAEAAAKLPTAEKSSRSEQMRDKLLDRIRKTRSGN